MEQYISKSALVAEIEKWLHQEHFLKKDYHDAYAFGLESVHKFLNTIEVKEVDLEKEIDDYMTKKWKGIEEDKRFYDMMKNNLRDIAKHFFELGLKAQHSSISIPNIDDIFEKEGIDPNSRDAKIFKECYYMALEKFISQKGR